MGFTPVLERERRKEPRYSYRPRIPEGERIDWVRLAAGGTMIVGGCLLLARKKRAGTVVAASGTAIALLNHEDTLRRWWQALPGYVEQSQRLMGKVLDALDSVGEMNESLRRDLPD